MKKLATYAKASKEYKKESCFEAGIKLIGQEVKSIKAGRAALDGSYVVVRGDEAYIINLDVPAWQPKNLESEYESDRTRKLLLHKKELRELLKYDGKKGLAILPFSLYNKGGLIKVEVCVATNKNRRDKRQEIKKRDTRRDIERTIKFRSQ